MNNILGWLPRLQTLLETEEQKSARLTREMQAKNLKKLEEQAQRGTKAVPEINDNERKCGNAASTDRSKSLQAAGNGDSEAILEDRDDLDEDRRKRIADLIALELQAPQDGDPSSYRAFNLTVCYTFTTLSNLFHRLFWFTRLPNYRREVHPKIYIKRLTILHSFAPEMVEYEQFEYFIQSLDALRFDELCYEAYTGGHILSLNTLDAIADRLRRPMSWHELIRDATQDVIPTVIRRVRLDEAGADPGMACSQDSPYVEAAELNQLEKYVRFHRQRRIRARAVTFDDRKVPEGRKGIENDDLHKASWRELNAFAGRFVRYILKLWKDKLVKLEITGHWLDIQKHVGTLIHLPLP